MSFCFEKKRYPPHPLRHASTKILSPICIKDEMRSVWTGSVATGQTIVLPSIFRASRRSSFVRANVVVFFILFSDFFSNVQVLDVGCCERCRSSYSHDFAYEKAIEANPKFLQPYLSIANILRADEPQRALEFYTKAIEVHPRSSLIRDKAYLMSELKDDAGAIALLDKMLADPQVEEGEGIGEKGSTEATLFKAKAAILADLGQMEEALAAATSAIEKVPTDPEAAQMIADIKASAVDAEAPAQ